MTTIGAIRDAIEVRLLTVAGVRVAQEWTDAINVSGSASVAVVEYAGQPYDPMMGQQGEDLNFTITLLATKDRVGRDKLDAFCDPTTGSATSVRTAVNGTLGSTVAFATVTATGGYREYPVGEGPEAPTFLGVEFTVKVAT